MRFFQVKKKELKCHGCEGYLERGEIAVWVGFKMRKEGMVFGKSSFIFHPQCFRDWSDKNFLGRWEEFKASLISRKKLGRPKIHRDGKAVNRLKALIAYHREAGHIAVVRKLEADLEGLLPGILMVNRSTHIPAEATGAILHILH